MEYTGIQWEATVGADSGGRQWNTVGAHSGGSQWGPTVGAEVLAPRGVQNTKSAGHKDLNQLSQGQNPLQLDAV